jgi:ABC-type uncharacterized transport system YnjBCD substrate-binding protein
MKLQSFDEFAEEMLESSRQFRLISNNANLCQDIVTTLSAFATYQAHLDALQEVFGGDRNGGDSVCVL